MRRAHSPVVDPRAGRLKPVFRDRDELTASPDLTAAVREAIAASRALIVVCTPNTPRSAWVGKEIALARSLGGDGSVLCALFEGEYPAAFHPALMRETTGGGTTQPLAADFRPGGDGRRLALLKLVAVLAGVGLDVLVQRDAQRRLRRVLAASLGAALVLAVIAVAVALALSARAQARQEQRRGVATVAQLVSQREQFTRAGRLDLLRAQDRAALNFFRGRDIAALPIDAQLLSAKLLHAVSEGNEKAGDLAGLDEASAEAWRTSHRLLAADPADTDSVLAHAHSEYWVGLAAWRHGDLARAGRHFTAYATLAGGLAARRPGHAEWQREAGDADSNLATFSLRAGDRVNAGRLFRSSLDRYRAAADIGPYSRAVQRDLADGHAWLADIERLSGRLPAALAHRVAQRRMLLELRRRDPDDAEIEADLIKNQLGMARIAALQERWADAIALFEDGRATARGQARRDRANADIARQARAFDLFQARAWLDMPPASRPPAERIASVLGNCAAERANPRLAEAATFCAILQARLTALRGSPDQARATLAGVGRGSDAPSLSEHWLLDLGAERRRALDDIDAARTGE